MDTAKAERGSENDGIGQDGQDLQDEDRVCRKNVDSPFSDADFHQQPILLILLILSKLLPVPISLCMGPANP
jgi:hypothetical protein